MLLTPEERAKLQQMAAAGDQAAAAALAADDRARAALSAQQPPPPAGGGESVHQIVTRAKQEAQLEAARQLGAAEMRAKQLEDELARRDKEKQELELNSMKPDERHRREMEMLRHQMQETARAAQEANAQALQRIRQAELYAYRERKLREAGDGIFEPLVGGNSEQEINESIELARAEYKQLETEFRKKFEAELSRQPQPTIPYVYNPQTGTYAPATAEYGVPVPPPNPAYAYAQPAPPGSYPTPQNPIPPQQTPITPDIKYITSEEAVRNGKYGEMRQQLLAGLRGQAAAPTPAGVAPRHTVQYQQLPGGVQQPIGLPTPPAFPPGMVRPAQPVQQVYQQPAPQYAYPPQQYAPPAPPPAPAPQIVHYAPPGAQSPAVAAAQAAVARTHAGANPLVAGDAQANAALHAAQVHGQQRGIDPQTAYAARFNPTPPAN